MIVRCLALLAVLGFSGAALAQGSRISQSDDVMVFDQCLEEAGLAFNARVQCIGRVFEACLEKQEDDSTTNVRECYTRETDLWERLIADVDTNLERRQDSPARTELGEASRTWESFRNSACNIPYVLNQQREPASVMGMACFNRSTALWALQLSEFVRPTGN